MFVALRDLRFARGRFALISGVVALITLLVGFLSGLTGGLALQNVSAVLALPADRLVFSSPSDGASTASFTDSAVTAEQIDAWSSAEGVDSAQPLGISQGRAENGSKRAAVAVFGVPVGFDDAAPARSGLVTLSEGAADELGAVAGDTVSVGGAAYQVDRVTPDAWYSHTPVVTVTLDDWQAQTTAPGAGAGVTATATVLAVTGDPDWTAVARTTGTVSESTLGSVRAIGSFTSEIGSLLMMVAMLFGISALVIGAFFTVWTMQRQGDVAVLKALGASTRSLVRDSLGQALVVLVIGIGVGIGLVSVLGALAGSALPFVLSPLTTVLPGVVMIALGLAGAAVALRAVTSADPLTALGGNR
ncbi:ABC transporter permease [Frigoribacterium sp. PhB24]|uniref:ABC transporter permease n=1 Tax=Frigoribacterium sp. PhB24 TaxID=2485204 RepID=UPI000F4A188E|nr:ABC transporter permease [Frigoribacterium sp. PhB24]ROS54130.1 putative ABC transport system permease protein [Frigoribacterium sp. PhB24]